jgi:hypothetical protein
LTLNQLVEGSSPSRGTISHPHQFSRFLSAPTKQLTLPDQAR